MPSSSSCHRRIARDGGCTVPGARSRIGEVHVLVPVVEAPVGRQLHERPVRRLQHVRLVVVHERRVVVEAVLDEQVERARARLPARGAIAVGRTPKRSRAARPASMSCRSSASSMRSGLRCEWPWCADLVAGGEDPLDRLRDSARPSSRGRRTWQARPAPRAARGCAARRRAARTADGSSRSDARRTDVPRRGSPTRRRRRRRGWRAPRSTRARSSAPILGPASPD